MSLKIILITLVIGLVGCAPKSVLTPQGQAAYTADQFINSLGVFQDAAIGANSAGTLSTNSTRIIVTFVKSSVTTAQQAPNGWQATVLTGLNQLQSNLPTADLTKYQIYINLLKTILASIS